MAVILSDFAVSFHVMHQAGDAGDWAVASHEVLMCNRSSTGCSAAPGNGALLDRYRSGPLNSLEALIEHGVQEVFGQAREQTVQVCNACHQAVESPFIRVTLEPPDVLNMRNPHKLRSSEAPRQHTHCDLHETVSDQPSGDHHEGKITDDH